MQNVSHSFQQGDILRISRMLSDLQQQVRNSSLPRVTVEMALSRMAWLDRIVDIRKVLASGNAEKKN
jgi:DNA polymerase-3 subunit gamma/tau